MLGNSQSLRGHDANLQICRTNASTNRAQQNQSRKRGDLCQADYIEFDLPVLWPECRMDPNTCFNPQNQHDVLNFEEMPGLMKKIS